MGASLTCQGEQVFARVLAAQRDLNRAAVDARMAESRVEGDCSILMSDGIANYWFAHFVRQFFDWYPDITLKTTLDHDIGAARNQIFDIRLHYYEPVDLAQVMRQLATVHFTPFASRQYLDTFGVPSKPADVANHKFVDQSQHLVGQGAWAAWSGDEILKHTALFTNQSAFLAKCARKGIGIALVSTYYEYLPLCHPEPSSFGASLCDQALCAARTEPAMRFRPMRVTIPRAHVALDTLTAYRLALFRSHPLKLFTRFRERVCYEIARLHVSDSLQDSQRTAVRLDCVL